MRSDLYAHNCFTAFVSCTIFFNHQPANYSFILLIPLFYFIFQWWLGLPPGFKFRDHSCWSTRDSSMVPEISSVLTSYKASTLPPELYLQYLIFSFTMHIQFK